MSIELYDAVNGDALFNVLGKAFQIIVALNTSRGTTIPQEVTDAATQWKLDTDSPAGVSRTLGQVSTALEQWQGGGESLAATVQAYAQDYVKQLVNADADLDNPTLANCLVELDRQMRAGSYYVTGNVASVVVTPSVVTTDVYVVGTLLRGDGKTNGQPLPEVINLRGDNLGQLLSVSSEAALSPLRWDWPGQGSGIGTPLTIATATVSLLANSGFETLTNGWPDSWTPYVGAPVTVWAVTVVEVQTVAMSGTPTTGFYYLVVTGPDGIPRLSEQLVYNAEASAVQASLRKLPGMAKVTVTATGTTPNFTHTVTFEGCASNLSMMSSVNRTDTGSIAHAQVTAGSDLAYTGRGMTLLGDGATLADLLIALPVLQPDTLYCLTWRQKVAAAATGQVRFAVMTGPGGSVVNDSAGNAVSVTVDVSTLTTSWAVGTLWVRVAPSASQPLVLSIKATAAVQNTKTYCLDELVLQQAATTYAGGPYLAAAGGNVPPTTSETWAVTVSNDRAGVLYEYCDRVLGLRSAGVVFATSGVTLIPNSLIS